MKFPSLGFSPEYNDHILSIFCPLTKPDPLNKTLFYGIRLLLLNYLCLNISLSF